MNMQSSIYFAMKTGMSTVCFVQFMKVLEDIN